MPIYWLVILAAIIGVIWLATRYPASRPAFLMLAFLLFILFVLFVAQP
jgi:hypothetical protein